LNINTIKPKKSTKRKTTETFSDEIKELTNGEYTVLGRYKNSKTPIDLLHSRCGNVYTVKPNSFISSGSRCTHCSGNKPHTLESAKEKVLSIFKGEYELVSGFKGVKEEATFKHNKCGELFSVRFNDFSSGKSGCKRCGKAKRIESNTKTHATFVNEVSDKYGMKFTVVSEYSKGRDKVELTCNIHMMNFITTPNTILNKDFCGCYKCREESFVKKRKFTKKEVVNYLENNTEIKMLSNEYKSTTDNLLFVCSSCDREFKTCFHTIMRTNMTTCKGCAITKANGTGIEEVRKYIEVNTTATLISDEYKNNTTKLRLMCECGEEFDTNFMKIKDRNKTRCSKCMGSVSNPEYRTMKFLDDNGIEYKYEYTFEDFKNKYGSYYRFDFAIFNKGELIKMIEVDGEQHYKPVNSWGGEEALKVTQQRDELKDLYCESKGIELIRIPYWEFDNIEKHLEALLM
jgi:hypothetical protein